MSPLLYRPGSKLHGVFTLFSLCVLVFLLLRIWGIVSRGNFAEQEEQPLDHDHNQQHYEPAIPKHIPRKIWYKLGPKGLSDDARRWTDSCIKGNPHYQYEFLNDDSADAYVAKHFSSRPDLVESYRALTVPILKADLFRYLLLYREGGMWSDLDVSCEGPPIDEWVPFKYKDQAALVVGWEFDVGWGDNFLRQFTSWTFMAAPGLPHLWMVVEDILKGIQKKSTEHNVSISGLKLDMVGDVVDFTGPRRLTESVFKSLEQTTGSSVDKASIAKLLEPKLVGDVLILPGYSFAASSNTYDKEDQDRVGPALVKHHYAGSWKNENGGELP